MTDLFVQISQAREDLLENEVQRVKSDHPGCREKTERQDYKDHLESGAKQGCRVFRDHRDEVSLIPKSETYARRCCEVDISLNLSAILEHVEANYKTDAALAS